jgi:hypothetical protein
VSPTTATPARDAFLSPLVGTALPHRDPGWHTTCMGIRQWARDHSMNEPVAGTFKVTSTDRTSGTKTVLTGVVTGPGLEPTPVQHRVDVPLKKLAAVFRRLDLPVMVDLADPSRLRIVWDDVPDEKQLDLMQAAQVAERMRRQPGESGHQTTYDGDMPAGLDLNALFGGLANGRNVSIHTTTTTSTSSSGDLPPELADLAQRVADQFGRAFGGVNPQGTTNSYDATNQYDTTPQDGPPAY